MIDMLISSDTTAGSSIHTRDSDTILRASDLSTFIDYKHIRDVPLNDLKQNFYRS